MKKWEEFLELLHGFPEINTYAKTLEKPDHEYGEDMLVIESNPFGVEAFTEEDAKDGLIRAVTEAIGDGSQHHIYVRLMPEVAELVDIQGNRTGKFMGYARIAYAPKAQP